MVGEFCATQHFKDIFLQSVGNYRGSVELEKVHVGFEQPFLKRY